MMSHLLFVFIDLLLLPVLSRDAVTGIADAIQKGVPIAWLIR